MTKAQLSLLLNLCAAAATASAPPLAKLVAELERLAVEHEVPAFGFALVEGDATLWAGARGIIDHVSGAEVGPETVFRIGSITKAFTALALLIAADDGAVALETPLAELMDIRYSPTRGHQRTPSASSTCSNIPPVSPIFRWRRCITTTRRRSRSNGRCAFVPRTVAPCGSRACTFPTAMPAPAWRRMCSSRAPLSSSRISCASTFSRQWRCARQRCCSTHAHARCWRQATTATGLHRSPIGTCCFAPSVPLTQRRATWGRS